MEALTSLCERLSRPLDALEEEETLSILSKLSRMPLDAPSIASSGVGKQVARLLKGSTSVAVKQQCVALVDQWKALVTSGSPQLTPATLNSKRKQPEQPSASQEPEKKPMGEVVTSPAVDSTPQKPKAEPYKTNVTDKPTIDTTAEPLAGADSLLSPKVDTNSYKIDQSDLVPGLKVNDVRISTRRKFKDALANHDSDKKQISPDEIVVKLESAMYMQYLKGSEKDREEPKKGNKDSEKELYLQRFRELVHSLRDPANVELRQALYDGSLDPSRLLTFSHKELAPKELQRQRTEELKTAIDTIRTDWKKAANVSDNGIFQCPKCKSRKTTFKQKQTRSADEPMTSFIDCHNCGHHWREG